LGAARINRDLRSFSYQQTKIHTNNNNDAITTMVAQPPKVSRPLVIHGITGRNPLALSPKLLKQKVPLQYKFHLADPSNDYSSDHSKGSSTSLSSLDDEQQSSSSSSSCENGNVNTTAAVAKIKAPSATAAEVRSKFMNKLGIAPQLPEGAAITRTHEIRRRDLEEPSYETELNDQSKAVSQTPAFFRLFTPQSSTVSEAGSDNTDNNTEQKKSGKRAVNFNPSVVVHPIPLHTAYSKRIRDTVWTSVSEMEENVARNCLEFAAENWDATQVVDDQDMVLYHGELVHPVHFAPWEKWTGTSRDNRRMHNNKG